MARITLTSEMSPESLHGMLGDYRFEMATENLGGQGRVFTCKERDVEGIKSILGNKIKGVELGV